MKPLSQTTLPTKTTPTKRFGLWLLGAVAAALLVGMPTASAAQTRTWSTPTVSLSSSTTGTNEVADAVATATHTTSASGQLDYGVIYTVRTTTPVLSGDYPNLGTPPAGYGFGARPASFQLAYTQTNSLSVHYNDVVSLCFGEYTNSTGGSTDPNRSFFNYPSQSQSVSRNLTSALDYRYNAGNGSCVASGDGTQWIFTDSFKVIGGVSHVYPWSATLTGTISAVSATVTP